MMTVLSTSTLLMLLSLLLSSNSVQAQDTCLIDGQTFQRGENVFSAFPDRCFATKNHVCICNPDKNPPVDCPFCSYSTNSDILRCANHNQEVTFMNLNGVGQRCTCTVDGNNVPSSTCVADPSAEQCSITLDDGSVFTQPPGQQFGRQSRCGATSEFPCFCNPNVPNGIECPYCGFATKTQGLLCLEDGETKLFDNIDGLRTMCSCQIPFPFDLPIQECVTVPTAAPVVSPQTGCSLFDSTTGQSVFVNDGGSLGDLSVSNCGPPQDWPCFCNANASDQIECPYCEIPQADGSTVCQIRNEIATTVNNNGQSQTCKCQPGNSRVPTLECGAFPTPAPVSFDGCAVPGTTSFIDNLQMFGAEVTGACGSHLDYPSFCNTQLQGEIEYPYCEYTNTASGITNCARDGEVIEYATNDAASSRTVCDCSYTTNAGAQSSCRPVPTPTPTPVPVNPTLEPTPAPTAPRDVNVQGGSSSPVALAWNVSVVLAMTVLVVVLL